MKKLYFYFNVLFFFLFDLIGEFNSDIWHFNDIFNERALSSVSSWVAIRENQLDEFMISLR